MAGRKRLFSMQSLANFGKGIIKLVLIGGVLTAMMWPEHHRLEGLENIDPGAVLPLTLKLMTAVAAADYLFQYRQWYEKQKMSLQEMKEEFRQTDGDPAIKGKL
jgi:flagellar biosynthetic protein FlhB